MRNKYFTILFITLFIVLFHSVCYGIKFNWMRVSVGTIRDAKEGKIGTGFIVGSNRQVVTCAHVALGSTYLFEPDYDESLPPESRKSYPIKLSYSLPRYDLSVFLADEDITTLPLPLGEFRRIRPGDFIGYVGWNSQTNKLEKSNSDVLATGSALNVELNDIAVVDFLEFEGIGKPGWSGGPVFNAEGKVVAIMREAWTKKGIKGGQEYLINRAFSTDILNLFNKEVFIKQEDGVKKGN